PQAVGSPAHSRGDRRGAPGAGPCLAAAAAPDAARPCPLRRAPLPALPTLRLPPALFRDRGDAADSVPRRHWRLGGGDAPRAAPAALPRPPPAHPDHAGPRPA